MKRMGLTQATISAYAAETIKAKTLTIWDFQPLFATINAALSVCFNISLNRRYLLRRRKFPCEYLQSQVCRV